jgi:hypothetical protein
MYCRGFAQACKKSPVSKGSLFSGQSRVAPHCVPGGARVVSGVSGLHVAIPLCSASESEWRGPTRNRLSPPSTTLCDGQWYLDAVLGRDLQDPHHMAGRPRRAAPPHRSPSYAPPRRAINKGTVQGAARKYESKCWKTLTIYESII